MEMNDNFYDKDKGEFNTGEDMKIAKILGDDIDNPKYTFRIIESITDKRIETLSKKFYEIKKESDSHKLDFDNMGTDIDNIFDNIEQELYYRIKTLFEDFDKQSNKIIFVLNSIKHQNNCIRSIFYLLIDFYLENTNIRIFLN